MIERSRRTLDYAIHFGFHRARACTSFFGLSQHHKVLVGVSDPDNACVIRFLNLSGEYARI